MGIANIAPSMCLTRKTGSGEVRERGATTRVLLADHRAQARAGVRQLLGEMGGFAVVAEAADGQEAVALALGCRPKLVVMAADMPRLNGVEATRRILQDHSVARVLILSARTGKDQVFRALRAGASGYVRQGSLADELRLAIDTVARGELFLSPSISRAVIEAYLSGAQAEAFSPKDLTPRQRKVLQLLAQGKSSQQIAEILNSSPRTIEFHQANIMERLGIDSLPGLIRYALRHGLVSSG
jgi:DNA-binding NarL/FixJ family response regulator